MYHDIERVSRSRTAAYYFLSDNRRALRIPAHQDIVVVDLYDNAKLGVAAERLPREIVLEYLWEEEVALNDDESKGLEFGSYNGKTMACNAAAPWSSTSAATCCPGSASRAPSISHPPGGGAAAAPRDRFAPTRPKRRRRRSSSPSRSRRSWRISKRASGARRPCWNTPPV